MQRTLNVKNMVLTAMLIALSIVIPMFMPRLTLPFFTITLAAHVPVLLSMFINPVCAVFVAIGSFIGFLFSAPIEVAFRALTHVIFACAGAVMLQRKGNIFLVWGVTMLLHAICETFVMYLFGFKLLEMQQTIPGANALIACLVIGGLTMFHHTGDFLITAALYKAIKPVGVFEGSIHLTPSKTL